MGDLTQEISRLTDSGTRRLDGRVVVVTGAGMTLDGALGTGAAMAHLFAAHGAKVVVVDTSTERGERTSNSILHAGGEALFLAYDVSDEAACRSVVARTIEAWGSLDGLVNNVGISRVGTVENIELETWETVCRVNLTSAILMTRAAAPALIEATGAIVNISSIAAIRSFGTVAYNVSKAGLIALTKDSAYTLGPKGVRANCILPGHMYASMSAAKSEEIRESRRQANVLLTEGTAFDVAATALFLLSTDARWITGVVLPVDGGTTNVTSLGMDRIHERSTL
jgi:NAD(P)-dependent dehydrogenase (short-subunit alcohol dehydrogenase family)